MGALEWKQLQNRLICQPLNFRQGNTEMKNRDFLTNDVNCQQFEGTWMSDLKFIFAVIQLFDIESELLVRHFGTFVDQMWPDGNMIFLAVLNEPAALFWKF